MALKIRRGSDTVRQTITPSEGELLYTTDTKKIFVGDGSTLGGSQVSGVNVGTAGTIPFYSSSSELSSGTNLIWDNVGNQLTVDKGSIVINNENTRRELLTIDSHYNSPLASSLMFRKSKGSAASPTAIVNSEILGNILFSGYTGTSNGYLISAGIKGIVDSSPIQTGTPFTINFVSKTGTGPYFVTYSFVTQGTAPVVSRSYTISGNENTLYNGARTVQESTTSSMVVSYTTDPGVYGAGNTTASLDAIITGTLILETTSPNGNLLKPFKVSSTGAVAIGAFGPDFLGITYDSSLSGQLSINSTKTFAAQTTGGAQLALRTFADTTYSQSINIVRSRGTTIVAAGLVSGDQISAIRWIGTSGVTAAAATAAQLSVTVDNTVSTGKVPGAITLSTANATSGTLTDAIKIDSVQQATFYGNVKHNALQIISPNYITVSSSTIYNLSATLTTNVLIVTANTYTATLNMPANPVDGQVCSIAVSGFSINLQTGTGTVLPSFAGSAKQPGTVFRYVYRTSNTTWYQIG